MAKKATDREYVWLQCTETGDLNYRTSIRVKGGIDEKVKEGYKKYCPRLRKHTLHKIKRKYVRRHLRRMDAGSSIGRAADSKSAG